MGFCTKCGYEIKDESSNFCSKCGTYLAGTNISPQASGPAYANNSIKTNNKPAGKKTLYITAGLLSFIILALGVGFFLYHTEMTAQLDRQKQQTEYYSRELDAKITALQDANSQLAAVNNQLNETKGQLHSVQDELALTQEELTLSQEETATAIDELVATSNKLTSAQKQLSAAETSLATTQDKLDMYMDTLNGLGIYLKASNSCLDVKLVDNPEATDPTWAELIEFLAQDTTEEHDYVANVYDCSQFSRDLHNNAEAHGIRAAEVQIAFEDEWYGHALNAFLTTDLGLVYIDCTGSPDKVTRIEVGKTVRGVNAYLYNFDSDNIRDNFWWDSLWQYYYIGNSQYDQYIVSDIFIYW